MIKAKKFLSWILAGTVLVTFCACRKVPYFTPVETPTEGPIPTTAPPTPDYMSELKMQLGIEPVPSTFAELQRFAELRKDSRGAFRVKEEHHCCEISYRGKLCSVVRYEKAQEWFEYRFRAGVDHLTFEKDSNGTVIIRDESYSGPEGMLMSYNFRAFVDESHKFLAVIEGYEWIPDVPDEDIAAFRGVYDGSVFVSVKEFRDYYSLNDSKIDDEIIEDYILKNRIHKNELAEREHGKILEEIIEYGNYDKLGYMIFSNLNDLEKARTPEEFIKDARWVYFEFEFPVPKSSDAKTENMYFDLRRNKVYLNVDTYNYRDAEKCVKLNEEALKSLQELPKNVGPSDGNKYHDLKYSYLVYIIDADGNYMKFSVQARNSVNALFDVYWRDLYKKCFGKDHKLVTKGFKPSDNEKRQLYRVSQNEM
ncbi:MAG: hypothetical protein K5869_07140 [Saccharofermentans sp.]|nr:hypothetical protein [Saccharofermentans sp.]